MNDTTLVNLEVNLTLLNLLNSLGYVHSNGARLGVRHKTTRTEDTAERAKLTHASRLGDDNINVGPTFLDLLDVLIKTYIVSTCCLSSCLLVGGTESEHANNFTSAIGQ